MSGRSVGFAVLLIALGLASGCDNSGSVTCSDVSAEVCTRLATCETLSPTFASLEQCESSLNGYFEVGNDDDASCLAEWIAVQSLDCARFSDHFGI